MLGEDVEVTIDLDRRLPLIKVDPAQIDQVVMNLVVNARDAMPRGGKLTIETQRAVLDEQYAATHLETAAGSYAMIAVTDTGVGMTEATRSRIFEPFYTTKSPEHGTGLGLSIVFGIVKQSGGSIWVYSEPNQGTTFRLYFPEAEPEAYAVPESVRPTSLTGTETVLVVEDQNDVRQATARVLKRYGYHVLTAGNAGEALLICEQHPHAIDLMLTDVVMPKMNGPELAQRLHQLRPALRVLYMSGYADTAAVQHGIIPAGVGYFQKPVVPQLLATRVREVLDSPARKLAHSPSRA